MMTSAIVPLAGNDLELNIDLEPFTDESTDHVHGILTVNMDIEQLDGSIEPLHLTGHYVIHDTRRYIHFPALDDRQTVLGSIQRHIAIINGLRLVDKKLLKRTIAELDKFKRKQEGGNHD